MRSIRFGYWRSSSPGCETEGPQLQAVSAMDFSLVEEASFREKGKKTHFEDLDEKATPSRRPLSMALPFMHPRPS